MPSDAAATAMPPVVPLRQRSRGSRAQLRVIHALFMRELLTRFGRSRIGYVWLVLEPMSLALMISTLHWASGHDLPNNIPIFLFYTLGYLPFMLFRSIVSRGANAVAANVPLLYHRNVKLFDVMVARNLMEAGVCTIAIALVMLVASIYAKEPPHQPVAFAMGLLLYALLAHGLAMLFATLMTIWEPFEHIVHPFTYIMMPLSGTFFMLEQMGTEQRELLLWIPLVHIAELCRWAQWGDRVVPYYDVSYVLWWIVALNLIGMAGLRVARPRIAMMD
jgi:capsular polysaccharide transport system permease protein